MEANLCTREEGEYMEKDGGGYSGMITIIAVVEPAAGRTG